MNALIQAEGGAGYGDGLGGRGGRGGGGDIHRDQLQHIQPSTRLSMLSLFFCIFRVFVLRPVISGFCFDTLCQDVIMDDKRLEDYNLDQKVN